MKKYRITKITVKTREVVSMSKISTDENRFHVCSVCHTTLGGSSTIAENSAAETQSEKQMLALLPSKFSENDN